MPSDDSGARVVIRPEERRDGSAMQQAGGAVRDLKLIYPETGFDAMTLCLGVVEIDPGHHSPLHRHRCEEVYYVVSGAGELESDGRHYALSPGCAVLNRPGVLHRVFNTGAEVLRLVVVAQISESKNCSRNVTALAGLKPVPRNSSMFCCAQSSSHLSHSRKSRRISSYSTKRCPYRQ